MYSSPTWDDTLILHADRHENQSSKNETSSGGKDLKPPADETKNEESAVKDPKPQPKVTKDPTPNRKRKNLRRT